MPEFSPRRQRGRLAPMSFPVNQEFGFQSIVRASRPRSGRRHSTRQEIRLAADWPGNYIQRVIRILNLRLSLLALLLSCATVRA
jgi:hypothetical protein